PFCSYQHTLLCDRAMFGGWQRAGEPIKPYTTAETMNAGWCWQTEHEHHISRGYVYSSSFVSDREAEAELRAKNPKIQATQTVSLRSGRHERLWVKNVVGVGAAASSVEPLEDTALTAVCLQCQALAETLSSSTQEPTVEAINRFNETAARGQDAIRDFL